MSENQSSRRKFLQFLGLTAGATLLSTSTSSGSIDPSEIKKLNPAQQDFMNRYGKWMDDYIEVIRVQKTDPHNSENHKRRDRLSEDAEAFKIELSQHMKDPTFSIIYLASIERMKNEI
jgi:hypothetical protein